MIMEEVHKQYHIHLLRYQTEISRHVVSKVNGVAVIPKQCSQILHVQQDLWSSSCMDSYLGVTLTKINDNGEFDSLPLACVPLTCNHSARVVFSACENVMNEMGASITDFGSATQDTTGSSINVFRGTGLIIVKCFAHLTNRMLEHGFEDCATLNSSLQPICDVMVLRSKSDKRKLLLIDALAAAGVAHRAPHKSSNTRWNDKEVTLRNFDHILPGLTTFYGSEMDMVDIERTRTRLNSSPENMEEVYSSNALIHTMTSEPRKRHALSHMGPKMCDCGCGQSGEFHMMRACSKCYLSYSLATCYRKFTCSTCLPSSGKRIMF